MNILVVDDEPFMRDAYLNLIDWVGNGLNLVGIAYDAFKALDIMHTTHIDVVITDIRMPKMSGIELIRQAKKEFPHIDFIVMSGYDDYSLVREAFVLGIKDYFLKDEIEPDHILEKLLELKKDITDKKVSAEENSSNQYLLQDNDYKFYNCEGLLKKLIWDGSKLEETERLLKQYNIHLEHNSLIIMVITVLDYRNVESTVWSNERETLKYAVMNVLREVCEKYEGLYPVHNSRGEYIVLGSLSRVFDIKRFFNEISDSLKSCFDFVCNGGYSESQGERSNAKQVYQEAKSACDYCFVTGNGKINDYKTLKLSDDKLDISFYVREIKKCFSHVETDTIRESAKKLRFPGDSIDYRHIDEVRNLFYVYYIEMVSFINEHNFSKDNFKKVYSFEQIKESADLWELNKWMTESMNELAESSLNLSRVGKAKQYILKHYAEPLSLHSVAVELNISESHLSRLFHQSEERSFSAFLLKVRIDAAKELMATTNLKIYEVAKNVGYLSAEQFSKAFKKATGISPKHFMK